MTAKRFNVCWQNTDGTIGESARTYESAAEAVELLDALCTAGAKVWFRPSPSPICPRSTIGGHACTNYKPSNRCHDCPVKEPS